MESGSRALAALQWIRIKWTLTTTQQVSELHAHRNFMSCPLLPTYITPPILILMQPQGTALEIR